MDTKVATAAKKVATPFAKAPTGAGWTLVSLERGAWRRGAFLVCSSSIIAEMPDGAGIGPQWLVSASVGGRRPTDAQLDVVRREFDMIEAEEDNHHPGIARMLFLVVDPARRIACECKVDESVVVDADGFTWTTPKDGPCRGCELERIHAYLGQNSPCPIHTR